MSDTVKRRTIRRYAHEVFPHPQEGEVRDLETEVKYLYAQWLGHELFGTDWFTLGDSDDPVKRRLTGLRTAHFIRLQQLALTADALHRGLTGQAAWEWVVKHHDPESEVTYDCAAKYLTDAEMERIKPYPVLEEIEPHEHVNRTTRIVTYAEGKESNCDECTEEPNR